MNADGSDLFVVDASPVRGAPVSDPRPNCATTEAPPLPDLVSTQDYCTAFSHLDWCMGMSPPYAKSILQRIVTRLEQKLDRHFFGHQPHLTTEQQALALLKTQAQELKRAGEELHQAAEAMKLKGGLMMPCNRAHIASKRALAEAAAYLA